MVLHPKQVEFIKSPATIRGYVGGRGAGKSFVGAYDLLRRARKDRFYLFASPTYPQLRDTALRTFKQQANRLDQLISINHTDKHAQIRTTDGGVADVSFRSTEDPESLRGPNLSGVWLDEASLMREETFDIVIGCLRERGQLGWLSITMTPKGRSHWTHKILVEKQVAETHLVQSSSNENPFLPAEFVPILSRRYSADKAIQEIGGQFIDLGGQLITYDAMMGCTADTLWGDNPNPTGPLYVGWDLGRSRNLSVIWTWERLGDTAWCRECHVMRDVPFDEQERQFVERVTRRNVARVVIDQGFAGMVYVERYKRKLGTNKVDGVSLSGGMQGLLAENLANAFDKRRVRIPDSDDIRDDFSLVGRPQNRNGKPWLSADDVGETADGCHADRFWAAALAFKAFEDSAHYRPAGFLPRSFKSSVN